jgi:hypothetical protein
VELLILISLIQEIGLAELEGVHLNIQHSVSDGTMVKARWHDGTKMKTRWSGGENTMYERGTTIARWCNNEGMMMKT